MHFATPSVLTVLLLLILLIALVVPVLTSAGAAAGDESASDAAATLRLLDRLTSSTPVGWSEEDLQALRAATRVDPQGVITHLVERLQVDEAVPSMPAESSLHSVCGNALTLLDRLTGEQVGGKTKEWIGFATRDHRGVSPDVTTIYGPWRAWLRVRRDVPVDRWFWGMAYADLAVVLPLLRKDPSSWSPEELAPVRALGARVYPLLLDKLMDDGWAGEDYRVCDRANTLLQRLTGDDLGEIVRYELLRLSPASPERKFRYALHENRASMALIQRRWMARLLAER